jgi:hypothetical protein
VDADKTRCNYPICESLEPTSQCPYCHGYFCAVHLTPRKPRKFEDESSHKEGHPCKQWVDHKDEAKLKDLTKDVPEDTKEAPTEAPKRKKKKEEPVRFVSLCLLSF